MCPHPSLHAPVLCVTIGLPAGCQCMQWGESSPGAAITALRSAHGCRAFSGVLRCAVQHGGATQVCRDSAGASEPELGHECCIITLSAPAVGSFYAFFIPVFKLAASLFEVSNCVVSSQSD